MPNSALQVNCNKEGFNVETAAEKVRIGIISNQENDCSSCDSRIGVGGEGVGGGASSNNDNSGGCECAFFCYK